MPLLETDALTIRSTFDSLPDEAKPLASDWLRRYKDQQDEFGLPLFPSEVETQQADESAFVSMFDDVKQVDPGNGIYDQAERLKSGEGDRLRQREAGMRFLAKHYRDEEKVRRDFPLYRDDYAMQNGGKRDMGDGEFYSFVSQQVKRQQGQKLVRSRSLDAGFRAAIEGMGSLEKLAAVKSQAATNADSEVDAGAFLEAYGETQKVMSKHAAFIRETFQAVSAEMDGGDVDLEPLKERLLDMPGTERRIVLAALRMEADKAGEKVKGEKGGKFDLFAGKLLQQTGEAAARIASNAMTGNREYESFVNLVPETGSVRFSGNAIKTPEDARKFVRESIAQDMASRASSSGAGPGGVGAFPPMDSRNEITLDEGAQRLIQDAKEREMKRLRVANEIRSIGEAADPIPNVFASTIGTSGAALALMAGTRGLAAPALASAYTNVEFNDLGLKYPQMSTADKTQIAAISGAAQAALDYVGVKALDKLPGIKSLIAQPLTKQLAGRALARGAMSFGLENVVEAGQDIATPALMQALKSDVPGFDWEAEQREFWKGRADVAIGLLPLTLLGIGAASVNEYRGAKNLLSWNDQLGAAGVVETDRVAVIEAAQSGDMGKAQSLLMEAWGRRNPEVAAEYQDAMSQRQTDMSRATAELERLGAIPTLRRDGEGWTVTSNGTSTKFATWEEARDVATAAMGDMERAQTELVASLSDSFMASTPAFLKGESVEFNTDSKGESLVDRVNAGAMTPEQAMEAAVAGGVIKGVTMQEARSIAAEVFGGQNASERAMQFRQDVEKIAVLGRNTVQNGQSRSIVNAAGNERSFLTVVEEVVEGRWKGGLERRAFTKDMGIRWVQLAEAATGAKFLEGSTWEEIAASSETAPRALTEAISRIIVADVLGRMKDGKRIGPGTVSSGLNLNDREQSALAAILDAFRKLFRALLETASKLAKARQEGKLGGEYDALFDALTGGSSQLEHDAGATKEADAIASEAVDTSGYSPETPGPNGETFSTRAVPADASKVVQMPDGARLVGPTTFSIRAFHGTPHKVDKFRLDKIGTGEGAQAYGWGLYFAESRDVGEGYRDKLAQWTLLTSDGKIYDDRKELKNLNVRAVLNKNGSIDEAVARARSVIESIPGTQGAELALADIATLEKLKQSGGLTKTKGNLYTVELLPDEDEFLDWDKPLSEQSEKVKAAIQPFTKNLGDDIFPTGGALYSQFIAEPRGEQKASEKLASLGIPGIRYLDSGSRGAGDGTRNYVIFDENLVRILEENGKPVSQETFSLRVTPAQDAEYMAAVEAGDMEKAQRMVDEAAKAAGYSVGPVFHGAQSPENFDRFEPRYGFMRYHYFASNPNYAKAMAKRPGGDYSGGKPRVLKAFLHLNNPYDLQVADSLAAVMKKLRDEFGGDLPAKVLSQFPLRREHEWAQPFALFLRDVAKDGDAFVNPVRQLLMSRGYDGVIFNEVGPTFDNEVKKHKTTTFVVFEPSQIKSADPVTRDDAGNVIPLSQRFNPADDRITFSLRVTPAQDAEYMAAVEAGDMEKVQRMVDEAAFENGLEEWFHGNTKSFGGFSSTDLGVHLGAEDAAQDRLEQTGQTSGVINKYYVDIKNPVKLKYDPDTWQALDVWQALPKDIKDKVEDSYEYVIQDLELGELKSELQKLGFDGIKYPNAFEGVGDSILVFDKAQIKSADPVTRDESGNVIPLSQRFNPADDRITYSLRVTPAQDADYLAAVKAGDMETAQRLVDSVRLKPREVFYVGNTEVVRNPNDGDYRQIKREHQKEYPNDKMGETTRFTTDKNGNRYIWRADYGMHSMIEPGIEAREKVAVGQNEFNWNRKSADPVTYDPAGNVIPLSQRFNPADNRITFSIRPGDFSARMAAKFSLFQAKPELRLAITQVAKERALRLGAEWIAKGDVIRSAKDIGKEARMREALAYEARMNEYLDGLSENARQTLEFEPSALEDDPLVSAMLDFGKLMSFTTAKKSGKVEAKSGDYDGQPWLPPAWFSKGAGIMPDQMAQAMFDAGLLPDAYTGTLWSELEKRIEATRKDKAAHREAVQAYKAAEKYARDASRAEADQWAENAKKQAGSPKAQRDMLKAALRTLDGILAAAPPEVRARVGGYVKLAGLATDEAMLAEIERRIDKLNVELEKYLKKQAVAEISKLFKKARPDMEAGKKGKGKDADMHALFAAAEAAADMDALAVAGRLADLDARIASGELTSEQEALAMTERGIVELVGDLKNADSGRAFSALDTLRDIYGGAWLKWKIAEIERKERRAGLRQDFIEATGKAGVRTERTKADKVNESLFGKGKAWLLNLSSMREVLAYAFGLDNERVTSLVDAERTASNTYEDANQRLGDEIEGLFTAMAGTRTKGERLRWNLSQRTIKTGKGELSQLEAIQALLMWRQEDGRRHMEGTRDESGKVTSSWSYDQAWIDEIEAALTPEARQVMSFIMGKYAAEWATLNPLYRARYGVNMPHHDAYAPITVTPVQTKAGEVVDPVTGSAVSGGSILTPGSLRTRSRNAIAEPDFRDALQTMILHSRQMEYWKAYYDLAVEMNAVLGNREVMNSVHAKGGKEAANALRQWIDVIGQGGFRDASLRLALFQAGSKLQGRAAGVALLGRMSAILSQSTQLAAAAVKMPVTSYLVRLAKLMTGGLGWRDAMRSDFIQRRFKTAPPIVRQAMDSLASAKPNEIQQLSRFFGNVLSGADAFFTSGTYAILLDYHREQGRAAGLTGAELDAYAHTEAERATEQVAQPLRTANRSLAELSNTGPLGKIGWAFASEARQKVALAAHAALNAKNDPVTAAKSAFLTFAIGGLFTQVLKNLLREAKGDDDGEMWSLGRLGYAMTIAPLASAIPFGSAIAGDSNMLSNIQRAIQTLGNEEVDFRDVDAMLSAAGLFNDTAASLAQLSHLGLDLGKILANAAD